ncbi:OmpP1/FadL family transporter [Alteraurantiacibacter aquimixticola]|uniref:Long-chain fatty acid transporter n=1 Tax=Alteraurantiacibacter aquimixticola TaxID=2489173 RepID=A0A4T3F2R3_9SPHN|nr:outer membrane protein transport protein [Alteraurantiacibacter aquimixticola]TIX51555.1 long-chain fatty acid transporter [Alteraurantiacibacter aquimixticola]
MSAHTASRTIRTRVAFAFTASALALLAASPAQATDGYFLNGIGAKAKGMGGVAIALPQDALSTATNPAAATALEKRVDFGVEIFVPDRGATISGNGAGLDGDYSGNGANPFILPEFGYVRPLSDHVSVALTINGNGGMNTDYEANPFANFGATGPAGVDLKQVFISPTIAVEFAEGHSLGVSPILLVQGFRATGIQPFTAASADPAHFTHNGTDWSFGGGFRVGYLGELAPGINVGAFYQSRIWAGGFDDYAGLFAQQGGFDVPESYGAGIAVQPVEGVTLGVDVKRIEYSEVQSVGNPLAPLFTGTPFGAEGGPGFGWEDVTVFKVGGSVDVSEDLTLRAGYGRSDNPVPSSETFINILAPGVVQDHFTVGATLGIGGGKELTAFAMRAPRNTVEGSGSIPAPYGGGEADVRLAETSFGMSFGWSF